MSVKQRLTRIPGVDTVITNNVIRGVFLSTGGLIPHPVSVWTFGGQRYHRRKGESMSRLRVRAIKEASATLSGGGIPVFFPEVEN
jgi:hypothetical protein